MQIGNRTFGVGGGLNDGVRIVLQDLDPACQIAGMIRAGLDGEAKVGGEKSRSQFGDKLLAGIASIAPFLSAKAAVQAARMTSPMHGFVAPGGIIAMSIVEGREGWKLDAVG